MYVKVEKSKEDSSPAGSQESRAVANSVGQKKNTGMQKVRFVDNRPESVQMEAHNLGRNSMLQLARNENSQAPKHKVFIGSSILQLKITGSFEREYLNYYFGPKEEALKLLSGYSPEKLRQEFVKFLEAVSVKKKPTLEELADYYKLEIADAVQPEEEEQIDYKLPQNWSKVGGMDETEGEIVAAHYNYDLINSTKLACEDRSHSPNGKVYKSGGIYIGADNTGHVGWSLKVWTKKKGNTLLYRGNFIWNGKSWSHNKRGTTGGDLSFP